MRGLLSTFVAAIAFAVALTVTTAAASDPVSAVSHETDSANVEETTTENGAVNETAPSTDADADDTEPGEGAGAVIFFVAYAGALVAMMTASIVIGYQDGKG